MTLLKGSVSAGPDPSSAVNQDFSNSNPDSPGTPCPLPSAPKAGGTPKKGAAIATGGALTPAVVKIINQSPLLTSQISKLQKQGWTFVSGAAGKGTFADRTTKTITIDPNMTGTPSQLLTNVSHEVGHARRGNPKAGPMKGKTEKQWLDGAVHQNLLDESDATLNNIKVRQDLLKHGGPKIDIAGAQGAQYLKDYNADPKTAREKIANAFGSGEHPSNQPASTYAQYYRPYWQAQWNAAHPPKPPAGKKGH